MPKTTDKTDLILPRISKVLQAAGKVPAEIIYTADGVSCLHLGAGTRYRIHQVGALTVAMLSLVLKGMSPDDSILWAQFITEPVADELSRRGMCYADTAGNMLLRFEGNFLQIRNCRKPQEIKESLAHGRCLTPTGLKVLFLLLTETEAITWNYREIAAKSGTTLGTVNYVMSDLRAKHFLFEHNRIRRLAEIQKLRLLWVDHYRLRLLPKVKVTRYAGELRTLPDDGAMVLGGESVAAKERLLQTGSALLWQQDGSVARTVIENRWRLAPDGNIEIRAAFWPAEQRRFKEHTPWLLVYADLLATDDSRCLEAAEEIRRRHLENKP